MAHPFLSSFLPSFLPIYIFLLCISFASSLVFCLIFFENHFDSWIFFESLALLGFSWSLALRHGSPSNHSRTFRYPGPAKLLVHVNPTHESDRPSLHWYHLVAGKIHCAWVPFDHVPLVILGLCYLASARQQRMSPPKWFPALRQQCLMQLHGHGTPDLPNICSPDLSVARRFDVSNA